MHSKVKQSHEEQCQQNKELITVAPFKYRGENAQQTQKWAVFEYHNDNLACKSQAASDFFWNS